MEIKEYSYAVGAVMTVEYRQGEIKSKIKAVDYNLIIDPEHNPPDLDITQYFQNGTPNQNGCETVSRVLLATIASNIKHMQANGWLDPQDHFNHCVAEIKKQMEHISGTKVFVDLKKIQA